MAPATPSAAAAPPTDPVRAALDDPAIYAGLVDHAIVAMHRWMADRPVTVRREAARQAVGDVAACALRRAADFDPARGDAAGWLHGILNLVVPTVARRERAQPAQPPADPGGWDRLALVFDRRPDAVADRLDVESILARLDPRHRLPLRMWFLDGLGYDAIAARLGVTLVAARGRVSRALAAARLVAGAAANGEGTP